MSMNDLLYPSTYVRAEDNNTPAWYEFLLDDKLLSTHLSQNDPEPSACSLIKQFFDQVKLKSLTLQNMSHLELLFVIIIIAG